MSLKNISVLLLTLCSLPALAGKGKGSQPKLVVGIVIDQMRWDYLYRFRDRYTDGGFERIMKDGFNCQNTFINYLPTFTAPGHACVYTGAVPALHGIAANDWYDNVEQRSVYCTEDASVSPVGSNNERAGKMSPKNLIATTITDELRLASNMASRVYGFAIKDRGSILPAGHLANGAFWFDDKTGNFISSTYYGNELPAWLNSFNGQKLAEQYIKTTWETLFPLNTYTQSLADNSPLYEGKLKGETAPVFPHSVKNFDGSNYNLLRYLPLGNTIIFDAARSCIEGEQLGMKANTDFLCLSFSSTDYAGHLFGPNAIEVEDMYLRLDKELSEFLKYLDGKVGKGKYTVFITADHGGAHNTQYMKDLKIPAGNAGESEMRKELNAYLAPMFAVDSPVREIMNYQVYLDEARIDKSKVDRDKLKKNIEQWLRRQKGVAFVVDMEEIEVAGVPEPLKTMIVNGYNRKRSGCLEIILEPAWYSDFAPTGTTHGSWNPYDTHIPLLWYGAGIPKGETHRTLHMTDISATLAALLHVQMPNACVGEVITEIVK